MKDYKLAMESIQNVKKLIKGMSFDDAYKKLHGFNLDGDVFDYDYGNITGTVYNDYGVAKISANCIYEIWDEERDCEPRIESEILELIDGGKSGT